MSERKHKDLWTELVDEAGEEEIDRAASVSVEQAEAELKAAGFDVAAERAKASAFLDALESGAPGQATEPPQATEAREATKATNPTKATKAAPQAVEEKRRSRSRPAVAWLAAAATFGGVTGGALVAAIQQPGLTGRAPPLQADLAAAAGLRSQAAAACDRKQWSVCLADLDKARAADPRGDDAPAVNGLRDKAIAGILKEPEALPR